MRMSAARAHGSESEAQTRFRSHVKARPAVDGLFGRKPKAGAVTELMSNAQSRVSLYHIVLRVLVDHQDVEYAVAAECDPQAGPILPLIAQLIRSLPAHEAAVCEDYSVDEVKRIRPASTTSSSRLGG